VSGDSVPAGGGDYRPGVGIMLLNRRGEVFVARRIDLPDEAWQMPQGGIDDGEDPKAAALRELAEETGIERAEILAESARWLHYDVPVDLLTRAWRTWRGRWRGQRQKWFLMRFIGSDDDINLAAGHPEFDAWKWVPAQDVPGLAVAFKRQVYLALVAEFGDLLDHTGKDHAVLERDT
jgi:putative (di)nucleoside polyphosphate hydrolase